VVSEIRFFYIYINIAENEVTMNNLETQDFRLPLCYLHTFLYEDTQVFPTNKLKEKFEDTIEVIRSRKWKKDTHS
jgi:xylose isomerase